MDVLIEIGDKITRLASV